MVTISGDNGSNWIVVSVAIIWVLFVVIAVSIQYLLLFRYTWLSVPCLPTGVAGYTPSRGTPFPGAQ
jgi:hypothetical protein